MSTEAQAPIPIARAPQDPDAMDVDSTPTTRNSLGGSGSYLGLSSSVGGSSSFRESMAVSFGKDVAECVYTNEPPRILQRAVVVIY